MIFQLIFKTDTQVGVVLSHQLDAGSTPFEFRIGVEDINNESAFKEIVPIGSTSKEWIKLGRPNKEEKIINIHPSLLPSFPGKNAHEQVIAYGAKVSGCTIHFVDEGMDSGPIILQESIPVLDNDTEDSLAKRILYLEHTLYPKAISLVMENKLKIIGRKVIIKE